MINQTLSSFSGYFAYLPPVVGVLLFTGLLAALEWGRHVGLRRVADNAGARPGLGAVEGALFALLGLLIAFTFSSGMSRLEARRALVVQEANDIGTAYLRIDYLPASHQEEIRALFRDYVDSRILSYDLLTENFELAATEWRRSQELQSSIWKKAVEACSTPEGQRAAMLVLPALNQMIDITSSRRVAFVTHAPLTIYAMLVAVALASAFLAGMGMSGGRRQSWVHALGFAAVISFTVYITLDIEFPRVGLVRIDNLDVLLVEARQAMDIVEP